MKFLFLLLTPLVLISGCQRSNETKIDHNYHETKNDLISWDNVFAQEQDDYLVYFYSESCGHCNEIKQDVITFYLKELIDMYFVCTDIDAVFGPTKNLIGVNTIDDFYIFGTPFLTRIKEHTVSEYYVGSNAIRNYINQFKY